MTEGQEPDQAPQAAAGRESDINVVGGHPPRRVMLRRDDTGNYQISMGGRMIQGFCQEFEEITGYAIGVNTQQQVRIHIEPIGRRQHARYPDRGEDTPPTDVVAEDSPVEIRDRSRPRLPWAEQARERGWQDEAREQLVREIELRQNMIDLLAGM